MEKKKKMASVVSKLALNVDKTSDGRCGIWFNQPKVPEGLKESNCRTTKE